MLIHLVPWTSVDLDTSGRTNNILTWKSTLETPHTIHLWDTGSIKGSDQSFCIEYDLFVRLDPLVVVDICRTALTFPTNLYFDRASWAFGGPQDPSTGIANINGYGFKSAPQGQSLFVSFQAITKSLVRVFVDGGSGAEILIKLKWRSQQNASAWFQLPQLSPSR